MSERRTEQTMNVSVETTHIDGIRDGGPELGELAQHTMVGTRKIGCIEKE